MEHTIYEAIKLKLALGLAGCFWAPGGSETVSEPVRYAQVESTLAELIHDGGADPEEAAKVASYLMAKSKEALQSFLEHEREKDKADKERGPGVVIQGEQTEHFGN